MASSLTTRAERRTGALLVALCCLVLVPAPTPAGELLRCKGPDGKLVYTDDKSVCPDAKPFEPQGRVTSAAPAAKPAARTPAARAWSLRGAGVEEAEAARWRSLKADKQTQLERIAKRREELRRFVTICNRRGRVVRYDDAGIEREVPCSEVQKIFAQLDEEAAQIRDYLENGLAEDCRRAGCLPGWIR